MGHNRGGRQVLIANALVFAYILFLAALEELNFFKVKKRTISCLASQWSISKLLFS
jgi:hypothetical protein